MCDRCGRGRNEFAGRVQNYHVRSSCHRNGYKINLSRATKSCCWSGHSALQATRTMPLLTLAIALATGKNTRLFGVLDQNKTRFSTYDGQEHKIIWRADQNKTRFSTYVACREQGSHCHDERLAWVASRGQWTSYSNSFVSKVLGANYNRAKNFHPDRK